VAAQIKKAAGLGTLPPLSPPILALSAFTQADSSTMRDGRGRGMTGSDPPWSQRVARHCRVEVDHAGFEVDSNELVLPTLAPVRILPVCHVGPAFRSR